MKKEKLIDALKRFPDDAEVKYIWDGKARSTVDFVWESRSGDIMLAEEDQVVYNTEERTPEAPTKKQDRYWRTGS